MALHPFKSQILSSCLPLFVSSRNGNHCVKRTRCVMGPNNGCEENQTGRKDRAGRGLSVVRAWSERGQSVVRAWSERETSLCLACQTLLILLLMLNYA